MKPLKTSRYYTFKASLMSCVSTSPFSCLYNIKKRINLIFLESFCVFCVKGLFGISLKRSILQTKVCLCRVETIASLAIVTEYVEE